MNNAVGISIAALALLWLYSEQQRKKKPAVRFTKKLPHNYHAATLPPFGVWIVEKEKANKKLLDHELIHWEQFQRMGLFGFWWQYLVEALKHGYDANALEVEARYAEDDYCKINYTYCVQKGIAKTVSDPKFRSNLK